MTIVYFCEIMYNACYKTKIQFSHRRVVFLKPLKIAVIGAGASGVAASVEAARKLTKLNIPYNITVFEHLNKPLKKLLVTGNGRCNFSNTEAAASKYHGNKKLIESVLSCEFTDITAFFAELGILPYVEDGRIYPHSQQATAVRQVLLSEAERLSINIECETDINLFKVNENRIGFTLNERSFDGVIVSCGGKASQKQGSDGSFYPTLKNLGYNFTPLAPALTAITCKDKDLKLLSGTRLKGSLSLFDGEKKLGEDSGEIQFTEKAVSGIPAFNLSHLAKSGQQIFADMFPEASINDLFEILYNQKMHYPARELETALCGILPQKAAFALIARGKIKEHTRLCEIDRKKLHELSRMCKHFEFNVTGTRDFPEAQVMSGGLNTELLNTKTLMSKKHGGLFFCGEILDAVGDCGGYNLHFAFTSGRLAGGSAVQYLTQKG